LLRCIAVSGFAAGNLMMISVGLWSSTEEAMGVFTRHFFHIVSAALALPAVIYAGRPFFYSAWSALKNYRTNMDLPISLAVILASLMSVFETSQQGEYVYFDSAVMLLFFLLIGRYLDARAKGKARESARSLLSMFEGVCTVIEGGKSSTLPIRSVREGMVILVAPGEYIPADGVLIHGQSELDTSLITGETLPRPVTVKDAVFAGTLNLLSPVQIKVTKASEGTLLSDIVRLMEKAEQAQAHYVRLADRAAQLYTPVVHVVALATFLGWTFLVQHPWQEALLYAITVLVITCPCALGLAVPVVQVLASSCLMRAGVLLKSGDALEKIAKVDVAVFDKTGTLTLGRPELLGDYEDSRLQLAASIAVNSKHPLSRSIERAYEGALLQVDQVKELPGKGLEGFYKGKLVRLGSRQWCGTKSNKTSALLELWLSVEGEKPLCFSFADRLRDDAKQVISSLQDLGIEVILLSGDRKEPVEEIAAALNIERYYDSCTPVDKCEFIEQLKGQGKHVLMVGDGLNDAPSCSTASVSISPAAAMDITQNAADIVFQGEQLNPVLKALRVGRYSTELVKQNFLLAVLYNMIAIPVAVLGYVTPLLAAVFMSGSSLVVIGNSYRLNLKEKG
jgi:Cu2+-exporting ATPase